MRNALCVLALVVVVVSLIAEAESRRWPFSERQRDRGHNRLRDRWNHFLRHLRGGWGLRRHRYNFGGLDSPFNFGFSLDFGQQQQDWWDGPNVCRSEETDNSTAEEVNAITHHYRTATHVCEESTTAYRCKTTIQSPDGQLTKVELLECCHGYSREAGEHGCPKRLPLSDLLTAARELGLNEFITAVSAVGLDEQLSRGNFTVFAPQDGAFPIPTGPGFTLGDQPKALMVSRPLLDKIENDLQAVLLGHLLPEPRRASSFSDEEVLETGSPYDSSIRINFYSRPEKLTTANCVRVTATDNVATNGVIHVVEKILPTVTSSLLDFIQRDEQFSFLKTALARANMVSTLKAEGQLTLFAPTNSAFERMDQALLDRLLTGDPECLQKVLKQHFLPHVICSAVIQGRAKSHNLLGNFLNLTRSEDDKVFVDDAQVVSADMMATNGVMHIIDAVLVPDDALDLASAALNNGLTELVRLVEKAQLVDVDNVTVFAPSNEAFQALPPELVKQLTSDVEFLERVLKYHVIPQELTTRDIYNNLMLDTLDAQGKVHINEYSSFPFGRHHKQTAQCASILTPNIKSCSGLIHIIDKVMIPPKGNVIDVLAADSKYSTLVRLVKKAGVADSLQEEGPFTVFAPTNQAFEQINKETLKELEGNREQLADVLKLHIFQDNLCCAGIFNNPWWSHQHINTLGGTLFLTRNHNNKPVINDAVIDSCDNLATNGIVHSIDTVLLPRPDPWYIFAK